MGTALVGMAVAGTGVASATTDTSAPLPSPPSSHGCEDLVSIAGYGEGGHLPCSAVDVWVDVDGDCADPETFTFYVDAEGLTPLTEYYISFTSDAFETTDGTEAEVEFDFTADKDGKATESYEVTEGDGVEVTSGAFTVDYDLYSQATRSLVDSDEVEVKGCPTTTAPVTTHPATTTTTAAPTTTATTTTAAAATTSVAPVAVQPAATQPAVLATTGTPVAAAALLGGGLLVAGAGALVATRRRAS